MGYNWRSKSWRTSTIANARINTYTNNNARSTSGQHRVNARPKVNRRKSRPNSSSGQAVTAVVAINLVWIIIRRIIGAGVLIAGLFLGYTFGGAYGF